MWNEILPWVLFNIFVVVMLALDLGVFHRKAHVIELKEALLWSVFWIALSLLFSVGMYFWYGPATALEFLAGYVIEKSLSVDNLFVFLLIFSYFAVPRLYQHKLLFWGILGALVMRFIFIIVGVALVEMFNWILYIFGFFLIVTAIKMALQKGKEIHPERNPILRLFRRFMPVTDDYQDDRFFVKRAGKYVATPLFIALIVVETSDVIFAVDSIPAVFAITLDPFVVYTSNVFAILGLRALYFALAGVVRMLHHIHYGLSGILLFVGVKMLLADIYKIPIGIALGVVGLILLISVISSVVRPPKVETAPIQADPPEEEKEPDLAPQVKE
ncbi:MAG: TerC family protein [Thermoplasmata archaeon]